MKRVGVLTSGGDAPGMNAAIRAITRCALDQKWTVFGVRRGYAGLIENDIEPLSSREVGGIMQLGGTVLGSARCPEFELEERRRQAIDHLGARGIEALFVIGGNGSQCGAAALTDLGFPIVGVAIDNDLVGTDISVGVDTALNIALEAIDRLKTTATSHQRAFLVEVMGRDSGYLALMAGIAGGTEVVVIPEIDTTPEAVASELRSAYVRGKAHALGVVAEGASYDGEKLAAYFREHRARIGFDLRVTVLGHVQRGGRPTAFDRVLATRLGAGAVESLARGEQGVLIGMVGGHVQATPLAEVAGNKKIVDPGLLQLSRVLEA